MSIAVSNTIRNAMSQLDKQTRPRFSILEGETPDNIVKSITVTMAGSYFTATIRAATIVLFGTDYNLNGKKVELGFSVMTDATERTWENVSYGVFKVYEQTVDIEKDITTLTAYDLMGELALTEYSAGDLDFPCTVANLAAQIAGKFGATLATDISNLPNGTYTISEDLYAKISGKTYRDILAEIAGATATMAIFSISGDLEFRVPPRSTTENFTHSDLHQYKIKPFYGPINSVVLSRKPIVGEDIFLKDDASIETYGLTELNISNNEILDDERQTVITPIYDAVLGLSYYPAENIISSGRGWYEPGDRIRITNNANDTFEIALTDVKLVIDGAVSEVLDGETPDEAITDYALAGSLQKTVYRTEVKVDKQNQEISATIERLIQFENETARNFSSIIQNISSIITSIQNSGGDNLIKNSAFYALDSDRLPLNWDIAGTGSWSAIPSADARANGSLSGQVIALAGETISQIVTVKPDNDDIAEADKTYYSFSCRIKKTSVGSCRVRLSDGTEEGIWDIEVANGETSNYKEFAIEGFLPHSTELTVSVYATNDAEFLITDMMLAVGSYRSKWTQANGEFSNSQVQIDSEGITVKNSNLAGAYVKITPQGLEIYLNSQLIAILSNTAVQAPKAVITDEVDIPPIKMVRQSDGLAFVPTE